MNSPEEIIAYVGRMLFERRLTDLAGGNISMRVGNEIFITPRYSGSKQHWSVDPCTIMRGAIEGYTLLDNPAFSREGLAHLLIYRTYPAARAVLHAHPYHVLPFCAAEREIPMVLEATELFGVLKPLKFAPSHTLELAAIIRDGLRGKEALMKELAAPVLMAKHGLLVVSDDLFKCLEAVERIDWNAWCVLAQQMMPVHANIWAQGTNRAQPILDARKIVR